MTPKIIAAALTLAASVAGGIVILFMMLIAMNGFSESDAQWGLIAYIVLAVATAVLMSVGAALLVRMMMDKQFSSLMALLTAIPAVAVLGIAIEVVCALIGIGIAEYVRVNY